MIYKWPYEFCSEEFFIEVDEQLVTGRHLYAHLTYVQWNSIAHRSLPRARSFFRGRYIIVLSTLSPNHPHQSTMLWNQNWPEIGHDNADRYHLTMSWNLSPDQHWHDIDSWYISHRENHPHHENTYNKQHGVIASHVVLCPSSMAMLMNTEVLLVIRGLAKCLSTVRHYITMPS